MDCVNYEFIRGAKIALECHFFGEHKATPAYHELTHILGNKRRLSFLLAGQSSKPAGIIRRRRLRAYVTFARQDTSSSRRNFGVLGITFGVVLTSRSQSKLNISGRRVKAVDRRMMVISLCTSILRGLRHQMGLESQIGVCEPRNTCIAGTQH